MKRALIRIKSGFHTYGNRHYALFLHVIPHCLLSFCCIPFQQKALSNLLHSENCEGCRACISSVIE